MSKGLQIEDHIKKRRSPLSQEMLLLNTYIKIELEFYIQNFILETTTT